jgi:hypothetical protein
MHEFALLAGLEVALFVGLVRKLREMRRLEKEIHLTAFDMALACGLAGRGRYEAAEAASRRWADRMRAHKRRQTPPSPPRREIMPALH